jgi:hypothetical protein
VDSLSDALVWLTIEGGGPTHDVQLWFSIYGIEPMDVNALEEQWLKALEQVPA